MFRGILSGAFWGFLLGGAILAVSSLMSDAPRSSSTQLVPPVPGLVDVPAGSQFDQSGVDRPISPPTEESLPASGDAPLVTAPVAPVAPTLSGETTASAAVPVTEADIAGLGAPPSGASDPGVTLRIEQAAEAEEPVIRTEQAAPSAADPGLEASEATAAPDPIARETSEEDVAAQIEAPSTDAETENEPEATPISQAPLQPRPQASVGGFGNLAEGVTIRRAGEGSDNSSTTANAQDTRPVVLFSEPDSWGGPDLRPPFSIVLIDEAGDGSLLPALGSFQGPLTFAIPANSANPRAAMQLYRDAGYEVVILADIPAGSAPSDVEVVMTGYLNLLPEAIAVMDGTFTGFGGDRAVAQQMVDILGEAGLGLVTLDQGLNTAGQIAQQAGLPSGTIFRDLDGKGQGNTVIRRFLDQAAFRATQSGGQILVARMRPETISALLIWHQQERAGRVNLAPLSALLLEN